MNKSFNYSLLLIILLIPVIIYLYFLQWKSGTIYGDDLYIFKGHEGLHSFSEKISMPVSSGKFRPVNGLSIHFLIELFQKNLTLYYAFNVGIQAINTFLFAVLLNLFLKSPSLSLVFSLAVGLSRFSFFNMSQLLNGGALEGLAMTFFFLSVFFFLRAIVQVGYSGIQQYREIISGILFANISMYTHERYLVLFPFIILVVLFYPHLSQLSKKQKISLCVFALGSVILNIVIKKAFYGIPFFVGTGGTNISFSFTSAIAFFIDAVLSVFQVNSGPEYLVGVRFTGLSSFEKLLVIVLLAGFVATLLIYARNIKKSKQKEWQHHLGVFLFLGILLVLFLAPAVITIRLEQRWLQASYSIFILMFIIAFSNIPFRNNYTRNWVLSLMLILILTVDFNYLNRGGNNIYMSYSEQTVKMVEKAIQDGIIKPETRNLYIWEKLRDANSESAINWDLAGGYFFNFYQHYDKNIFFVDSIYQKKYPFAFTSFVGFDKNTGQIIYLDNSNITDITGDYLLDSLKEFSATINRQAITGNQPYVQNRLLITSNDFEKFTVTGFYENENGIRWTDGNAMIGFGGDYMVKDSLDIILKTYMPVVCKNIDPKISLIDKNGKVHEPLLSKKEGAIFTFKFYFQEQNSLQKINIRSDKINASLPDKKILSFPFISLEIKRQAL